MDSEISRRRFMDLLVGLGGAGVVFVTTWPLLRFLQPPKTTSESGDWIDAGTVEEIQASGFKDILGGTGVPLILVAGADGEIAALEKKCPHLGCMVALGKGELDCPCHGAKFALDGTLISGPAPRGLKRYQVETRANGHVFVGKEVA
jgi:Rieske Fe-S protein